MSIDSVGVSEADAYRPLHGMISDSPLTECRGTRPTMPPDASLARINVDYSCFGASSDAWLRVSDNKYACTDAAAVSSVCDQVITSRNIRAGWLTEFLLGGLNCQIKHHLFPSMPRPSLRLARQPVRAFCEQHETTYREAGLVSSYVHVHAVGGSLRPEFEY
jgi:hypothetical protein